MALRFQRRIRVLPGVRLNISKSGVSTSIGVTGAHATFGHGKRRATIGVPGTGVSHTTIASAPRRRADAAAVTRSGTAASVSIGHALGRGARFLWRHALGLIAICALVVIVFGVV